MKILPIFLLFFLSCLDLAAAPSRTLVLCGPVFACISHPFARMIEMQALQDVAENVELRAWKSADQMRAMVREGDCDFVAVPSNVAATLYNKGVNIHLLNISVWGILDLVTRDKNLRRLEDFRGKEILVPMRGEMPDIVLRTLLRQKGLRPQKDIKLAYTNTAILQIFLTGRYDNVLLPEPLTTMVMQKSKSALFRSVDLEEVYGKVFSKEAQMPQAGIAFVGNQDPHVVERVAEEYDKAVIWYKNYPQEAGALAAKYFPMVEAAAVTESLAHIRFQSVAAADAREELEFFFGILQQADPKMIGGRLPETDFYRKP